MSYGLIQADARHFPLRDASVDLVLFSPPYWALRSYRDDGRHYDGQIGSEPTPREFLNSLWVVMHEVWRVLKPSGSCFVNLGDKRAGSGGHNNAGIAKQTSDGGVVKATRRTAPDRYNQSSVVAQVDTAAAVRGVRAKTKLLLPHRFAVGCEDGLADPDGVGWIVRQDLRWEKANGLPESVTDRTRDDFEYIFHLTREGRYYSAVEELREPSTAGRLPGSTWRIAGEPLIIPDAVKARHGLPDHFAAFPTELPRRIILGWSPPAICVACDQGRFPVTVKSRSKSRPASHSDGYLDATGDDHRGDREPVEVEIVGYACDCTPRTHHRGKRGGADGGWKEGREPLPEQLADPDWHTPGNAVPRRPGGFGTKIPAPEVPEWEYHLEGWEPPPTRPAVVLDPFGGTGTTVGVARSLGRFGIGLDLSWDYCRLARWRIERSGHFAKVMARTHGERQTALF